MKVLKLTILTLLNFTFTCLTGSAQSTQKDSWSFPFELTEYNNLSVQAILNNTDTVHLMFHTAANYLTLTEEAIKKMKSLRFDGADTVKSWGGGGNESRFSKGNLLSIGSRQWQNVSIWENKNSGQHTDGKFGIDLFTGKVIAIDFDRRLITISNDLPAQKLLKKYDRLHLTYEDEMMFVTASGNIGQDTLTNKFLIHSGYAGDILLDDKFVEAHQLGDKLKVIDEKQLKDSYGNVLKTKKAILPVFVIGKQKLANVPVGFFQGALGRQKISILGGDIIKRFNIVIDANREFIYFRTNSLSSTTFTTV